MEGCGREVRLHDVVQIAHAPFTNLAGNVSNMSATCRRHVGDMSATWRNVAYFCPDRANLATWFLVCRHTFVLQFSDIDVPQTDEIQLSVLLIPTSNVDLHNRSPQQKAQKNH